MGNHVIRDRIWESSKLRKCSLSAALAYPWVFLVADDWGRFEYHPRRIWSKVFGGREDVTVEQVTAWLSEYEHVGLLERYHVDGELAAWTRFEGRPPSKRRASLYPDPEGFKWRKRVPRRYPTGTRPVPTSVAEQSRAEMEQSGGSDAVAPPPEPPPTPASPAEATAKALKVLGTAPGWNTEFADDFREVYGVKAVPGMFFRQVEGVAVKYGWKVTRPVLHDYMRETPVDLLAIPKVLAVRIEQAQNGTRWNPARAGPPSKAQERSNRLRAFVTGRVDAGKSGGVDAGVGRAQGELPGSGGGRSGDSSSRLRLPERNPALPDGSPVAVRGERGDPE